MNISQNLRNFSQIKRTLGTTKLMLNKPSTTPQGIPDVPGLSSAVMQVPNEPVGPGAGKNTNYKNPEYFSYDKTSYFQAEVEMLKYRCPQPSVNQYYKPSSS